MSNLNFSDFIWFTEKKKKNELAITVPNLHNFNLCPRLLLQLPERISIGISPDGKTVLIRKNTPDETGITPPKSGCVKLGELINYIVSKGVLLPARYNVSKEDDCWIGILDNQPSVTNKRIIKVPSRKISDSELFNLQNEVKKHVK